MAQDKQYRHSMHAFYNSIEWTTLSNKVRADRCYICERCGGTSSKMIVHHIIEINPSNVSDTSISLNEDNLELLCIECHNKHHKRKAMRYRFDEDGKIIYC